MRRISFTHTAEAVRTRRKTVTRRTGWIRLKRGDRLLAVDRIRRPGAQVLATIEVVDIRFERLDAITPEDVVREGFERHECLMFIRMFCEMNGCEPATLVRRIEFRYLTLCQGCGFEIVAGETLCGECVCEEDTCA